MPCSNLRALSCAEAGSPFLHFISIIVTWTEGSDPGRQPMANSLGVLKRGRCSTVLSTYTADRQLVPLVTLRFLGMVPSTPNNNGTVIK